MLLTELQIGICGDDEMIVEEFLFRTLGLKSRLSEIEIDDSNFEVMAAKAVRLGNLGNAFVPLDKNDVINIFKMCL